MLTRTQVKSVIFTKNIFAVLFTKTDRIKKVQPFVLEPELVCFGRSYWQCFAQKVKCLRIKNLKKPETTYTHAHLWFPLSFLAVNHHNNKNWVLSILTHNLWLSLMGMKQKIIYFFEKINSKWPTEFFNSFTKWH